MVNDLVLVESIMDNMISRQRDSCTAVRMLALRGLGNMASGSPEKVRTGLCGALNSRAAALERPWEVVLLQKASYSFPSCHP